MMFVDAQKAADLDPPLENRGLNKGVTTRHEY
jgi:hypothetical protein